jgi:ribonuclease HII
MPSPLLAGIDDATKCPCIGSIFLAGVAASPSTIRKWKSLGVKDSKLLSRKKRDALAIAIKETAQAFSVREIVPARIDDKRLNLNAWEMVTVLEILGDLRRSRPDIVRVRIDNWEVSKPHFFARLEQVAPECAMGNLDGLVYLPEHRADERYVVVGAASILAKSGSDAQYDAYREQYGNFGSGSPGDPLTRKYVWETRNDPPPIVRRSWNTFKHLSSLERLEDDLICRTKRIRSH